MAEGGDFLSDIITSMLDLFGLSGVPTTFSEFIWWCVCLFAGLSFAKFVIALPFSFIRKLNEGR